MPNEKLADGVFVVYAGPDFAVDPNATHAYEIERRDGRAVEKWWPLERLYDALTMPSGQRKDCFEHKYNMTKVNAKPRKLARFTYRVIVEHGIEILRFAAFPPKRQEDWYLLPRGDQEVAARRREEGSGAEPRCTAFARRRQALQYEVKSETQPGGN